MTDLKELQKGEFVALEDYDIGWVKAKMVADAVGPSPWGIKIFTSASGRGRWVNDGSKVFKLEPLFANHEMVYLAKNIQK
jgi:hypothetical protein